MAKKQTIYYCQNCGVKHAQWMGKCSSCGEWNTLVEEVVEKSSSSKSKQRPATTRQPKRIKDISYSKETRINLFNDEVNRVLGGGLVQGSIVLVGGEPGIGKSTLMLQVGTALSDAKVLYISGEESEQQIRMRAERISYTNNDCLILSETNLEDILSHIKSTRPEIVIIDSIQTLHSEKLESAAGSISQIRECASELQQYAKYYNIPVFLIGHITKDGHLAGPKVLEHMVDTVLHFEGDRNYGYRILRTTKNRFGSASELGIFEMGGNGLREVSNPSELLLSQHTEDLSGIAIAATMEGMRPMLIEVQALVSSAAYGTPQRSATGFDVKRLNMLLAVLEKRNGFKLGAKDVFLNIAGGIKVDDPAIDLAVVASVLSSNVDEPLPLKICFAGEVGLSGEIRTVNKIDQRIGEAAKLGFKQIYISGNNVQSLDHFKDKIQIVPVKSVRELFLALFKG